MQYAAHMIDYVRSPLFRHSHEVRMMALVKYERMTNIANEFPNVKGYAKRGTANNKYRQVMTELSEYCGDEFLMPDVEFVQRTATDRRFLIVVNFNSIPEYTGEYHTMAMWLAHHGIPVWRRT